MMVESPEADFAMDVLVYTPEEFERMRAEENPLLTRAVEEGQVIYERPEGARWLEQAKRDLESAEVLYQNKLWWIACFQAQQAAEKAVKSFLHSGGERVVLGHSVSSLVSEASAKNPGFSLPIPQNNSIASIFLRAILTPSRWNPSGFIP